MPSRRTSRINLAFTDLPEILPGKLRPPFGILLGSPHEAAHLAAALPEGEVVCYQMDLFQAGRLRELLIVEKRTAEVVVAADLWDLPRPVQTMIYPVPRGGERGLKIDMVEQAQHALAPHGILVVLSPYEKDEFFPGLLKKIFGRSHAPMSGHNKVLWAQKSKEKPRRRHEIEFQVRADEKTSLRFVSRPGAFSYGKFDDGARALVETMEIHPGDRVLDLGCGLGSNGIIASRRTGPEGSVLFADSNARCTALADLNAKKLGVENFEVVNTCTFNELPERSFDVVLANPPYYAQLSIAIFFVERARALLKRKGRLFLVTKQADMLGPLVADKFGPTEAVERRGYVVLCASRR